MTESATLATESQASRRGDRHIDYIDGLRCVAVLAVIAYHLDAAILPGGFAGVDVFFVISGFVVSSSLARFDKPSLWQYLTYFYSRRLRRIAPALVVCLLTTALATALLVPAAWLSDTNDATGLRAFFGLSNFYLLETSGDYFSPKTDFNPYTHTWSLGVEEQFYLVFPLLFFAWSYARRGVSIAFFALAVGASLVLGATSAADHPAAAFYMLTYRFWELGVGVLLYQALSLRSGRRTPGGLATGGAVLATVLLAAGLWTARESETPFPDGILPVLGTLGLLGFLYDGTGGTAVRRALESRAAVAIGKISYSLYLWHWPTFVVFRWTVGLDSVAAGASALAITFAAATASYLYVEKPFRYAGVMVRAPRFAVIAVGVLAVGTCAFGYRALVGDQPSLSLSVVAQNAADWYPDTRGSTSGASECPAAGAGANLNGGVLTVFSRACERPGAAGRVFVIGDSHALAYDTMLREAAAQTGRGVFRYSKGGCAVLSLRPDYRVPGCGKFGVAALRDMVRRSRAGDVLFLPSLRVARLSEMWATLSEEKARRWNFGRGATAGRREAEKVAARLLEPLVARGVHVVFEGPTPVFRAPPFRCADWFTRDNPICRPGLSIDRAELEANRAPVLDSYRRLSRSVSRMTVWDPFPLLCPQRVCHAMRGGRPLFFDGDHLSGYANRLLLGSFVGHLADLGRDTEPGTTLASIRPGSAAPSG